MPKNIFLSSVTETINYTPNGGGGRTQLPSRDRVTHAQKLTEKLQEIWTSVEQNDQQRQAVSLPVKNGTYVEFKSEINFKLNTKSLENIKAGIRLLNVKKEEVTEGNFVYKATVFIPKGKEEYFIKKITEYATRENKEGPKNQNLVATIDDIKHAVLESFWIGKINWIPNEEPVWCEIWIREIEGSLEAENQVKESLERLQIESKSQTLSFPERKVILIYANSVQLNNLISESGYIAEIRRATEVNDFFIEMENVEQVDWSKDLIERLNIEESNVYVSILDSGLNNGHILIESSANDSDVNSYFGDSGNDILGHGTNMAGVAIYGDLKTALVTAEPVSITHALESYKILPDNGVNNPQLYGAITSQSVSSLFIDNPERNRIICMAVSSDNFSFSDGRPSSWSAAIDDLISGSSDYLRKVFLVSGGNVREPEKLIDYPEINQLEAIEDPGQSWNAITVGAYTNLVDTSDPTYELVANKGGLSPYSRTSILYDNKWPIKPEIVLEGGNAVKSDNAAYGDCDLAVLTTHHRPTERQFSTINATSSATATASWIAAKIAYTYPNAWPETIRALLIHSAEWTDEMQRQFKQDESKASYRNLLKNCGYGVPSLKRAIDTIQNRVNLIVESELQPFAKVESRYVTKDMHIHEIPWPKDLLLEMFDAEVKLKITLSYYIEPGPGEIGWKDKYRYASCGLRFALNGTNDKNSFLRKINKAIQDEEEELTSESNNIKWTLGPTNRNRGSIHSDTWVGTAAELSESNYIGVYPVIGWWRERAHLKKWDKSIKYSLVISLETSNTDIDLLTPIQLQISTPIGVEVSLD